MKRKIKIQTPFLGIEQPEAEIIIDKDGMRVETTAAGGADRFIRELIITCINMDEWKHSWHIDVDRAKRKASDERKKIAGILNDKIKRREDEIAMIKDAKNVLRKWNSSHRSW